jgi:predicted Rossmann fold flavoprotein
VVLDVSRVVSGHEAPQTLVLEVDLFPALSEEQLGEWLRTESVAEAKKQLVAVLAPQVPKRLGEIVLAQAREAKDRKAASLTKEQRGRIVHALKHLPVPITGTLGFNKAEVTAGGIALDEVDSSTMQSKLVPNLYFAGEILDLDGPIGGYNFQAAWSTGWLAGGS